ncbi:fluoride efflux transporter CrcB [Arenicella xantha]|uniref:Fluoride-specific ion channel FluC n=1 Tax=Arenicella xantha TaxID=644221 RepID=A0A395JGV8_9GAMM|nr:fluoride efflux transporter CrcB [Arenicella xantha]RBP49156.1 camphor resistance protein CrcB [Arenicella xantha]
MSTSSSRRLVANYMFYLAIMLAGGTGVLLRYLLTRLTVHLGWSALPFGTIIANLVGCFLIGYLSWVLVHRWPVSPETQVVLTTGFLGGFTTFSAFSLEALMMFEHGAEVKAFAYIALQVILGISMCLLGLMLAKHA